MLVDLASIGFVDRIGYRASMILAHDNGGCRSDFAHSIAGVPAEIRSVGLLIAVMIYAIGGGLAGGAGKSCGGSLPYR